MSSNERVESANQAALLEEYREGGANLRLYSNMRFAQLTVFAAITGALTSVMFSTDQEPNLFLMPVFSFLGIVATSILWVMEESSNNYWAHYMDRLVEIEKELTIFQYTKRRKRTLISATNAVRTMYAISLIVWSVVFCVSGWRAMESLEIIKIAGWLH